MEKLCELVNSLKPSEIRALKANYMVKERTNPDLRGVLLDLILKKRVLRDEQASLHIYKSFPGSSFSHLKNRLFDDICNLLALQESGTTDAASAARAEVGRMLNVARTLKDRGLPFQSFELCKEALDKALKFTLVPELMGLKDFISSAFPDFWQKERIRVLSVLSRSVKAESERLEAVNLLETVNSEKDPERYVAELNMIYRRSSCEQIKSLVHRSMIRLHLEHGNSDHLFNECILLYSLNLENSNETRPINIQEVYSDITRTALHMNAFDSAVDFAKAGLSFPGNDVSLRLELLEELALAYLNLRLTDEAHEVLKEYERIALSNPYVSSSALRFSYVKAWCFFLIGDHKQSLRTIAVCETHSRKKETWHAGFSVLELFNLLRLKTYFQLDYKVENFRKYLVRHELQDHSQLQLIHRCFKCFVDNDYSEAAVQPLLKTDLGYRRNIEGLDVIDLQSELKSLFLSAKKEDARSLVNVR